MLLIFITGIRTPTQHRFRSTKVLRLPAQHVPQELVPLMVLGPTILTIPLTEALSTGWGLAMTAITTVDPLLWD